MLFIFRNLKSTNNLKIRPKYATGGKPGWHIYNMDFDLSVSPHRKMQQAKEIPERKDN